MLSAAAAWDGLAWQLESFAVDYSSVISELQEYHWSGSSSAAMANAAALYLAWVTTTAAQSERAAGHARMAAAAFDAAFAATVPPAMVAANRTEFAILVATNFFGQNTVAIAANEAAYAEMWAQDAAAMFGYAASSAAAVDITPFTQPPQTTSPAGQSAQPAAVAHTVGHSAAAAQSALSQALSATPQHLHALSTAGSSGSPTTGTLNGLEELATLDGPADFLSAGVRTAALAGDFVTEVNLYGFQAGNVAAAPPIAGATTAVVTTDPAPRPVLASMGRAESAGRLSIPQSWATTTAAAGPADKPAQPPRTAFRALPSWAGAPAAGSPGGASPAGLGPPARLAARPIRVAARRMQVRRYQIPRPAVGG